MDDLIDHLSGGGLRALRARRPEVRDRAEAAWRALVTSSYGRVPVAERAALAARIAGSEDDKLATHYRAISAPPAATERFERLMRFAELVAGQPAQVDQAAIDALRANGFSPQDVVAVTQLAAFVPLQVRLLAGLRALAGGAAPRPGAPAPVRAAGAYTMDEVPWTPRLPPVDAATATPEQLSALENCPPAQRRSTYFLTLALDPPSLAERGALFERVMYAPRGLPRAERELATAVTSMVNGCVYCTSAHASRFAELTKEPEVMRRLLEDGLDAPLDARRRAIVAFSAKLTAAPGAVESSDMAPLRAAGLDELGLLDLVHAVAMFANANRLMQALGETG